MNTRQKLTLGIAAIFMVTLTIVGVTYAYFFTRVEYGRKDKTDVEASTATISSIEYWEASPETITFANAIPGKTYDKVFGAENPNESAGTFNIALTNSIPTAPEGEDPYATFIHSSDALYSDFAKLEEVDTGCYDDSLDEGDDCYGGDYYDNIVFSLYNEAGTALAEDDNGNTFENIKLLKDAGTNTEQFLVDENGQKAVFTVKAGETAKYTLKVTYVNRTIENSDNQNLEFNAGLNIRVTIK